MLDERRPVKLAKWPFYLADLVLSGIIVFVLYQLGTFEGTTEMVIVAACLVAATVAAWISIIPWMKEHDAAVQLNDSSNLKSSLEQIKSVEKVADLVRQSNLQWQSIQDASARTIATAGEITDRMKTEADEFMKFLAQAHDQERAGLRLEVEKMRRMEGDWIKVAVQMLDHTYALYRAAERSGQRNVIAQLSQFQNACRAVVRRMGLAPFTPGAGDLFDARAHQLPDAKQTIPEGAKISEVLASGFTYQGQLLRRALVMLENPNRPAETHPAPIEEPVPEETGISEEFISSEAPAEHSEPDQSFEPAGPETFEEPQNPLEQAENPEIAADMEAFETIEQPESPSPNPPAPGDLAAEPPEQRPAKKPSPQEELPF